MELIKRTNIDFLGLRRVAFVVSSILCILGIVCIVMIAMGKANLGIDFAGGASVNLVFAKPVHTDQARKALDAAGFTDAEIQSFTESTKLLVRVKNLKGIAVRDIVGRI